MTWSIDKEFHFSASHQLEGLPEGHQCGRLHGHNYIVRVQLESEVLDGVGFILDYAALAPIKRLIDDTLDHRHLNDALGAELGNTTAEKMAWWLAQEAGTLLDLPDHVRVSVGVSETPKTWAWWRP